MSIQATVYRKLKSRTGKGFSLGELKEAGLGFRKAFEMGIPIDTRRSTKHEANVGTLRKHLSEELKPEKRTPVSESKEIREERGQKEVAVPEAATDLNKVRGISPKLAEKLKQAGINDANELATSSP